MHPRFFLFIAATTPALFNPLRADAPPFVDEASTLLWQRAPLETEKSTDISRREFVDHATREIHFLSQLRAWREVFRDGEIVSGEWPDAASASQTQGQQEWGARLGTGSAAGGQGLGLALEWARNRREEAHQDAWKVGITYR